MCWNNLGSWSTESRVWNAGKGVLQSFGSGGIISLVYLLISGIIIAHTFSAASVALAANEAIPFTGLSKPSFDLSAIIEKAEHLPVLKDNQYTVEDKTYRAVFAPEGVTYIPILPGSSPSSPVFFQVSQIGLSSGQVLWSRGMSGESLRRENTLIYQRTPDITEVYEILSGGVEQSWILKRNQGFSSDSDLRIVMEVETSLAGRITSHGGIEFVDQNGAPHARYSKATIIDAYGKVLEAAPSWDAEGSRIILNISGEWLAAAAYPVVVDPLIGTNVRVDSLTTADNYPAIAFDGVNYLIVWQTGTPAVDGAGSTAIKGVRVSSAGTVLDATPLAIGDTAGSDDTAPSVAYDSLNSRYIVVWTMWSSETQSDIFRNTVTISPTVVVGTPASIISGIASEILYAYPSVACCDVNNNYYVVYGATAGGANSFTSFRGQTYNRTTHAAATASNPVATVSSGAISPNTEPRSAPRLYSLSSTKYLLLWETFGADTNGDISANLLTVTATPGYTWGVQVSVAATATTLERYPRAAFDGTNALIVYQRGATTAADILGRFVTPGATSLTIGATTYSISALVGSGQTYPDVAYTAGTCSANPMNRYMVIWQDYRNNATNPDIYGAPVDTAGTVGTEVAFATATTYVKQNPVIAANSGGCSFMAAWGDQRNGASNADIYAQGVGYPNIANLSPISGAIGTAISINGLNFGADPGAGNRSTATNNVKLNTTQVPDANITSWVDTVISFTIPTGTVDGTYPVTVTAGSWTSNASNLSVVNTPLQITTTTLPAGRQWLNYSATLTATGGVAPYTWSVVFGSLPLGLTLNSTTGVISGTPSSFGISNFTVQATDSSTPTPQTATQALSITVYDLTAITVTPANPAIVQGQTVQFTATGTYSDNTTSDITNIVTWSSSNIAVATVNTSGLATGVGLGAVTISATK